MSKVAIVGVEGSGKTVLMTVFGERYRRQTLQGYFLHALDTKTLYVIATNIRRMREGNWPNATGGDDIISLEWRLKRRMNNAVEDVCDVSFLDYPGESIRCAFSEGRPNSEDESTEFCEIDVIRKYVESSDVLLVLINLKDVINAVNEAAFQMLDLSLKIIERAKACYPAKKRIALVFTKFDVYRAHVENAGGLRSFYLNALTHISNIYPNLDLLAVSAVNRTIVNAEGEEVPAQDFESDGLDTILDWIVSSPQPSNIDLDDEPTSIGHYRDISSVKCDAIPVQMFSGTSVRPECHLVDEEFDYTLEKGKDYIVQYESVDVPGFATVVITGIGEYCGEKRVQFEIKKEETPKPTPSPLKKIPCDQFEDYEGVYDGKNHGLGLIENACVSEIDAQLTWFNNKTKSWENKFPGFVDVCDRTFTVKITASGYAEHTELRRIRILPKPLSLDMVENVSFSEYEDDDGGFITSRLKMKDVEPCVIQDKDWAIVETWTKTDLIVVTGRGNYCGTLEIKIKEDENSTEDFSVGSPQSKQGRKWRAWLQLLGSLLLLVVLWASIDWSGILSFNSDFDKGENQFSDSYENVTSPGWGFNPTPCKAPDYVDGERYKDGDCRTFTLPVKAKYPDGVHSVKMEMVYVAPGEFNMGSEDDVLGAAPIHPVKITKGYWIAKYPITQAQWVTLIAYSKLKLKNDGQWFCSVGGGKDYVKGLDTSDFPMESISWNDCDALVKALNSNETFSVEWMIPTEAQWEFAAKGGNKSKGYKFSGCDDIDMVGWYKNNSGGRTHSVLEKIKGNELGIVGMSGNVWEWCRDAWARDYYQKCKSKGVVKDPCNVTEDKSRVVRGGGWGYDAVLCRSEARPLGMNRDGREKSIGFRLACSAGPREEVSDSANKKKSTAELEKNTSAAIQAFNRKDYAEFWRLVEYADKNDAIIIRCLGDAYCLMGRKGKKINWERAVEQYEKLINLVDIAERGEVEARIASIYLTKILNWEKGYEYARTSARNGSLRGWGLLGFCHQLGAGCSIDYYVAIDCFEKSSYSTDANVRDIANKKIKELKEEVAKIENIAIEFVMAFASQDTNKLSKVMFDWDKHSGLIEQEFIQESEQEIKNKKFSVRLKRYDSSDSEFIKEKSGVLAEAYDTSLWLGSKRLLAGPDVLVKFIDGEFKASIVNLQGWE